MKDYERDFDKCEFCKSNKAIAFWILPILGEVFVCDECDTKLEAGWEVKL